MINSINDPLIRLLQQMDNDLFEEKETRNGNNDLSFINCRKLKIYDEYKGKIINLIGERYN